MTYPIAGVVLCIDDNADNRILVEETLGPEGIRVVSVASGDAGIAHLREHPVDLVLLDVRMPGKDGFTTLDALRALPHGEKVPVVFFTALRDLDTFDRALAAGGADFLTKPVRPAELAARVATLLKLERLGAEVHAHHERIRQQRDALMRLQLQRERLTAYVVHDLKSPLASMRLHANLLERDRTLSEDSRESAKTIAMLTDRLQQLIMGLLDLAKADEGRLEPKRVRVPLRPLAEKVEKELAIAASERKLTLLVAVPDDVAALGDPELLARVLENLVDNAVRHAPAKSTVRIEANAQDDTVELCVRDEGAGVPPELRDKIFDRFAQLDPQAARSRVGRGLGLSFCRAAVELQGGEIFVDPARAGTAFVARLPRASEDE